MSAPEEVFNRKEKKYLISHNQYDLLMQRIGGLLCYGEYGRSVISSLYYDDDIDSLINKSMEKPLYKEKIRIRAYGATTPDSRVFIELKKKFRGIVYKRRVGCTLDAARAYMDDDIPFDTAVRLFPLEHAEEQAQCLTPKAQQIAREIDAFRRQHENLRPSMMIVTNRLALQSTDVNAVRITFDQGPTWRTDHLTFDSNALAHQLLPANKMIMEIKCQGAYPLWLVHALSEAAVFPQSYSKYGNAYTAAHPTQQPRAAVAPVHHPAENTRSRFSHPAHALLKQANEEGALYVG